MVHVPDSFTGHEAGNDCPFNGAPAWLSVPTASARHGRQTGLGFPTSPSGDIRQWLLLALAS